MIIRLAKESELKDVVRIYDILRATPGSSWDEYYPTMEHARRDFEAGGLYVAVDDAAAEDDAAAVAADDAAAADIAAEDDSSCAEKIVGTVSAIPPLEGEDDELWTALDCWDPRITNPCDAARLGVLPNRQGQGIARKLIEHILQDIPKRGFDGIIFAVSKENPRAIEIYRSMGFDFCGEFNFWDEDMYSCQRYFEKE